MAGSTPDTASVAVARTRIFHDAAHRAFLTLQIARGDLTGIDQLIGNVANGNKFPNQCF
jgi:hypothetical protein